MTTLGELLDRADQGEAQAMFELGLIYSAGTMVDKDLGRGVEYFRRAFELGMEEPIYHLARAYGEGGDGLDRDLSEAFYWWRQAATWGKLEDAAEAYHWVGRAYAEGSIVVRDRTQAIFWLEKAVNSGQSEAKTLLDELKSQEN
ncbi:MAG: sel1 repeat family protein [Deltaproteobacteria bacterium]|jgi:TPR repeat protein|nr:sel1 repeat family protein [Deltaproteobacteria bacterium]